MARWMSVLLLLCAYRALPIEAGPVAAKPEELGLSSERLARIHDAVQRHIDAKELSDAVTLIAGFQLMRIVIVLIWCRTALILFKRVADRVYGKPIDSGP